MDSKLYKTITVAVPGDMLGVMKSDQPTDEMREVTKTLAALADFTDCVIVCYGGRSQAEYIQSVMREAVKEGVVPDAPIDEAVAMSEGFLGFNLEQLLSAALRASGHEDCLPTTAILTQTVHGQPGELPHVLEADAVRILSEHCRYLLTGGVPVHRTASGFSGTNNMPDVFINAAAVADAAEADCLLMLIPDSGTQDNARTETVKELLANKNPYIKVMVCRIGEAVQKLREMSES